MVYTARTCRLERHCSPRTLKQWLACRVQHGALLSEQIAERAEIPHGRLRAYANENQPDQIPFVALVRVCRVVGDWSAFDLVLVPEGWRLQSTTATPQKSIIEETLDTAAASGRVVAAIHEAQRDGRVSLDEAADIRARIVQLRQEADELEHTVIDGTTVPFPVGVSR